MNIDDRVYKISGTLKNYRCSPSKINNILKTIRNKTSFDALDILSVLNKDSAKDLKIHLESLLASAENNDKVDISSLYVAHAYANKALTYKRMRPRARGRGSRILKKGSHVTLTLNEIGS